MLKFKKFQTRNIKTAMNLFKNILLLSFFVLVFLFDSNSNLLAQDSSSGFAVSIPVIGDGVKDTLIVCSTDSGYALCQNSYSPNMYGVITLNPSVYFDSSDTDLYPVVSNGKVYVKVKADKQIKVGDYITSSEVLGVGQKALKSGYVLGTALEEVAPQEGIDTKEILVSISVKPAILTQEAGMNLISLIKEGIDGAFLSPLSAFRYFLSGLIVIVTLVISLIHFGRVLKSGVDALGRNPLASRSIQLGLLLNVILIIASIAVGLTIAFLILKL